VTDAKPSQLHHGDEFGKAGASTALRGQDVPLIGEAASIAIDAQVERESGVTPPPPPFSIKTAIIVLVTVFVLALIAGLILLQHMPPLPGQG